MIKVTAGSLTKAISELPRDQEYHYINKANKGRIQIVRVDLPEGPITIKR
jgi:hypothetical protein